MIALIGLGLILKYLLVALIIPIGWYYKRKARQATGDFVKYRAGVRRKAQPFSTEWVKAVNSDWLKEAPFYEFVIGLERAGFRPIGAYSPRNNSNVSVAGFIDEERNIHATVGKNNKALSFITRYLDGSEFLTSNRKSVISVHSPWSERVVCEDFAVPELLQEFLSRKPDKPTIQATHENYMDLEIAGLKRYSAWLAERGGANHAEVRRRLEASGQLAKAEDPEQLIKVIRADEAEKAFCNWLREQPNIPFSLDENLETLVTIHDDLDPGLLVNAYWCATHDYSVKEEAFAGLSPRESFWNLVERRPGKLKRVFQKKTPLEADFYLPA
jgi:hypothetical protein